MPEVLEYGPYMGISGAERMRWAMKEHESSLQELHPQLIWTVEAKRLLASNRSKIEWFQSEVVDDIWACEEIARKLLPDLSKEEVKNLMRLDAGRIGPRWMVLQKMLEIMGTEDVVNLPLMVDYSQKETRYLRSPVIKMAEIFPGYFLNKAPIQPVEEMKYAQWNNVGIWADNSVKLRREINKAHRGLSGGIFYIGCLVRDDLSPNVLAGMKKDNKRRLGGMEIPGHLCKFVSSIEGIIIVSAGGELDVVGDELTHLPYLLVPVDLWSSADLEGDQWAGEIFSRLIYVEAKWRATRMNKTLGLLPASHVVEAYAANEALKYYSVSTRAKELQGIMRSIDGSEWCDFWDWVCHAYKRLAEQGLLGQGMPDMNNIWKNRGYDNKTVPQMKMESILAAWSRLQPGIMINEGILK